MQYEVVEWIRGNIANGVILTYQTKTPGEAPLSTRINGVSGYELYLLTESGSRFIPLSEIHVLKGTTDSCNSMCFDADLVEQFLDQKPFRNIPPVRTEETWRN